MLHVVASVEGFEQSGFRHGVYDSLDRRVQTRSRSYPLGRDHRCWGVQVATSIASLPQAAVLRSNEPVVRVAGVDRARYDASGVLLSVAKCIGVIVRRSDAFPQACRWG